MHDLMQSTTLGAILRIVSRGRIYGWEEYKNPALVELYLNNKNPPQPPLAPSTPSPKPPKSRRRRRALARHRHEPGQAQAPSPRSSKEEAEDEQPESEPESDSEEKKDQEKEERPEDFKEKDAADDASLSRNQQHPNLTPRSASALQDAEKGQDFVLIDWLENDPANPQNWSTPKKFFVTFQICLLTTSVYIGSAIYTAGLGGVVEQFHVSETAALLGLSLFVAGYGLGPMVWAPLTEMPMIGRLGPYIMTLLVFVGLQPAVIYAPNFGALLAFRFITGLFGSPVLATGGASIADMYSPQKRAYGISVWGFAAVLGPVLGPLVGGFAAQAEGWRWTIWELMWLSGFCLVFLTIFLPETSASAILWKRTTRLRRALGPSARPIKSQSEIEAEGFTPRELVMMVLVRPFTLSFTEPIVLALNLYIALLYALLYLWFESFPLVFQGIYHFNLGQEGLAFAGLLVGAFLVVPPFWWYLYNYTEPKFVNGEIKPEYRLPPAIFGGICLPICLFWFGWSARESVHWIVPIIGTVWFCIGAFLLFNSVLNYLGDAYPRHAASVYAGNDLFRSSFGAGFPLFARAMYNRLGIDWGSSLLAFLTIAFIPIPILLVKYGERLRKSSKAARHDI